MAAMAAPRANAETAKVPVVQVGERPARRTHAGLLVAAGIVVVGAAALTIGVLSTQNGTIGSPRTSTEFVALPDDAAVAATTGKTTDFATAGEDQLASRVHDAVATSLPRIQAATSSAMREGSGMFVSDEGHIATSAGLIAGAEYVVVWTEDDRRWEAEVVAADSFSDVAIVRIDSDEWPAASLGTDANVWSGQYALAVDHTTKNVSIGEVTAVDSSRVVVRQPVAVPGSAIIDDTGAVIAMVTADGSNSSATPGWMVAQVAVDLIDHGTTTHAWLGVSAENAVDEPMAIVREVLPDSPAADAGLRRGDLIDSIDGEPVIDAATLWRQVQQREPGDAATLTVTRHGNRRLVAITLGVLPTAID
jgi:S1-C subfamily serine protease